MGRKNNKKKIVHSNAKLNSIINPKSLLPEQIKHDQPIEVRKTVLQERFSGYMESLSQIYKEVTNIKEELECIKVKLDVQISSQKAVTAYIEPDFLLKEKISTNFNYLSFALSLSGILFAISSYVLIRFLGFSTLFIGIPFLFEFIGNTLILNSGDKRRTKLLLHGLGGIALALVSVCIALIINHIRTSATIYENSLSFHIIPFVALITAGLCLIYAIKTAKEFFSKG